jgi:hypothetical protein
MISSKEKYKISLCGWPNLQIASCNIKNNSDVFRVGQNNNLVHTVKLRQNT